MGRAGILGADASHRPILQFQRGTAQDPLIRDSHNVCMYVCVIALEYCMSVLCISQEARLWRQEQERQLEQIERSRQLGQGYHRSREQ